MRTVAVHCGRLRASRPLLLSRRPVWTSDIAVTVGDNGDMNVVAAGPAYQPDAWQSFAVAEVGASAALAGLLVVACSINIGQILKLPAIVSRLAGTLAIFTAVLLIGSLLLVPGQSRVVAGIEIAVVGAALAAAVFRVARPGRRATVPPKLHRRRDHRHRFVATVRYRRRDLRDGHPWRPLLARPWRRYRFHDRARECLDSARRDPSLVVLTQDNYRYADHTADGRRAMLGRGGAVGRHIM